MHEDPDSNRCVWPENCTSFGQKTMLMFQAYYTYSFHQPFAASPVSDSRRHFEVGARADERMFNAMPIHPKHCGLPEMRTPL